MRRQPTVQMFGVVLALVGFAGSFVSTTVLMEDLPDGVLALVATTGSLLAAVAVAGARRVINAVRVGGRESIIALAGGALAFGVAPLIVLSQRASDAPPGTEVLLMTTSLWALIAVIAAAFARSAERSLAPVALAILGAVGGAATLANWEFPSSLSPFVRFPVQNLTMLVAGAVFAVGSLTLARAARATGSATTAGLAALGAWAITLPFGLAAIGSAGPALARTSGALVVLAAFGAAALVGWVRVIHDGGPEWASCALVLVPAGLTLLAVAERSLTVYGPNPIRWAAAGSGIALSFVAVAGLWWWRVDGRPPLGTAAGTDASGSDGSSSSGRSSAGAAYQAAHGTAEPTAATGLVPIVVAALPVIVASAALALPALRATIAGAFEGEYRAAWTMLGIEAASGWLALAVSLLALAAVAELRSGRTVRARVVAAAAVISPLAYPFLAGTPFRTATRWIPADVQQTLGTEYARITFASVHEPVRLAALACAALIGGAVIIASVRSVRKGVTVEGTA